MLDVCLPSWRFAPFGGSRIGPQAKGRGTVNIQHPTLNIQFSSEEGASRPHHAKAQHKTRAFDT
jgi:hypothetical protein